MLGNNIDASGLSFTPISSFYGTLDGAGYTISGLTINDSSPSSLYVGLFGQTVNAQIQNIVLANESVDVPASIPGTVRGVGGLVGSAQQTTISGVVTSGNVLVGGSYSGPTGGLVGFKFGGTVENSSTSASVTGGASSGDIGGLVGGTQYGFIRNSYATGRVTGGDNSFNIGGLVGTNSNNGIIDSYATGAVSAGGHSGTLGGLVGNNEGPIYTSYASGAVRTGASSLGSLVGALGGLVGNNGSGGSISNSYAVGSVTGNTGVTDIGGLAGDSDGPMTNVYAAETINPNGGVNVGGLVGTDFSALYCIPNPCDGSISHGYW
ncbi:MAG TPA: GLUG motif-containing protein, partial [Gammaproteobacteria bacterium]|nr:GLUG motif-containing protein [Gammaproteobacteria bacterium]